MNCPACGAELDQVTEHCPACHSIIAPRLDGALAPDPSFVTPPAKPRGEDAEAVAWRNEVNERVRQRRKKRGLPAKLPLFPEESPEPEAHTEPEGEPEEARHVVARSTPQMSDDDDPLAAMPLRRDDEPEALDEDEDVSVEEPLELPPLRRDTLTDAGSDEPVPFADLEPMGGDDGEDPDSEDDAWNLGLGEPSPDVRPLERPATATERLQAAVVDLAILATVAAAVVYFSFKAAEVGPVELLAAWPYLGGFVAFFGLLYAAYFTGISGCTPGKTAFGLRVVDTSGHAPGVWRAAARALIGAAGTLAVVGALPIFFDPARRTLPDRLFRTRVIRL